MVCPPSRWGFVVRLGFIGCCLTLLGCARQVESDARADEPAPPRPTNLLIRETSPYLLAHAHDPVDWYPWGPDALAKARKEDKLIFLSIGYSSCHWCHVMQRKVFSDPEIARFMNENFVNIKIDREERPDLDEIYMSALTLYYQAIQSSQTAGWPLSMFLTPDGKPLGGGTYFAPQDDGEQPGFPTLMKRVTQSWTENRSEMETNAEFLARAVKTYARPRMALKEISLDRELVTVATKKMQAGFDPEYGGFNFNPAEPDRAKFPVPTKLALMQYEARRHGDKTAEQMLFRTLDRMAAGGIHDHVGGGFHRYSIDRYWHVPHFEKMLYDNAQLAEIYAEAFLQTNNIHYRNVADGIVRFVLREMTSPEGGFYSALDAETDNVEGKYYVWTTEQIAAALSPDELRLFQSAYRLGEKPVLDAKGQVLELTSPMVELSDRFQLPPGTLEYRLSEIDKRLLLVRQRRQAPPCDDKILTSWNGLMIASLARTGTILEKREYVQSAERAASFLLARLRDDNGRLLHSYRDKQAKVHAFLDDYAFLVQGLLALYQATGDQKWANAACRLTDQQLEQFWDDRQKGCYFTPHDHEDLLARLKSAYDSVLPSGNSVTVRNLLRLASITRKAKYREHARETLELFAPLCSESPSGMTNMILALGEYLDAPDFAAGIKVIPSSQPPAAELAAITSGDQTTATAPTNRRLIQETGLSGSQPGAVTQAAVLAGNAASSPRVIPVAGKKSKKKPELVAGAIYLSVDRLPAGNRCKLLVYLKIADKWHINANPAQPDYMVPTSVTVKSKQGTTLSKVYYPQGKKLQTPDMTEPLVVWEKDARILGLLDIPANAAGRREELTFEIKYQACNDQQCLPPKTMKLVLPIDVARQGEQVRSINDKLFKPPAQP